MPYAGIIPNRIRPAWRAWTSPGLLTLALGLLVSGVARAQEPAAEPLPRLPDGIVLPEPTNSDRLPDTVVLPEPTASPKLPDIPSIPIRGRKHVESFIEGLSRGDAKLKVKVGHGRILNLKKDLFAGANGQPSIAVGDPSILDFTPVSARQIRILGLRLGSTDLSIETADGQTVDLDVVVGPDLDILRGQLRETFPDADLTLGQVGDHIVIEGEARSLAQISQILRTLRNSVAMAVGPNLPSGSSPLTSGAPLAGAGTGANATNPNQPANLGFSSEGVGTVRILNLLRVPTSQQVLLKVRIAELNRTALRRVGGNVLGYDSKSQSIFGTQIGNPATATGRVDPLTLNSGANAGNQVPARGLLGSAASAISGNTTMFGIFQNSNFDVFLNALRQNSVLKILAEPNLVAFNGHRASFLAGGEFPIPVPQVGATGVASTITVNFKKFGVQLDFLPVILDGESIRLTVDPEVSSIDNSLGTTLVAGGSPVPGLNVRNAHTTVELRQGQTLAIAGLMQLALDGQTTRIPGLGDLPVLGPFFSNTTSNRIEKELVVLVTPYLVEPMNADQVPPVPGDEVGGPNDLEFYILNRIEGRTGRDFRATTDAADPLRIGKLIHLEQKNIRGPYGFSE